MRFKIYLSFNLIGSWKVDGPWVLTQKVESSPCSDGKAIGQELKGGNIFFHPRTMGGCSDTPNHSLVSTSLILPGEKQNGLGCLILCLQQMTHISFSTLYNSQTM